MNKVHDGMTQLQEDNLMVTIDSNTGAVIIDLIAYGTVRIVMTPDGDIEVEGRSILDRAQWTSFCGDLAKRA